MDFSVGVQLFRREMAKMARFFHGLFCDWLPAVIVGLPLATILILCQPFKHIRIYSVDCHRIGHLLKHYFYLCEKPLAEDRKNDFHYLIHPASKASNPYWWGKWRSQIQVLPHSVGRWLVMALGWLPGGKSHLEVKYELIGGSAGTLKMLCRQESPVLHFSPKESSEGRDLLDSLGLGLGEFETLSEEQRRLAHVNELMTLGSATLERLDGESAAAIVLNLQACLRNIAQSSAASIQFRHTYSH